MSKTIPPVVCIVGRSGSGKTQLLTLLLKTLKQRGYSIGTIKHHVHEDFDIDREGKDTWKHAQAGADTVIISSPVKLAMIKKTEAETPLDTIVTSYLADRDIILADGYNLSGKPRILIQQTPEDLELFNKGKILATVKQGNSDPELIAQLADTIEEYIQQAHE